MAVDRDPARRHIVEPRDEVHEGGLARTRHADEGDDLALADLERDLLERHLARVRITEVHPLEDEGVAERLEPRGARAIGDRGRQVQDVEDALDGRRGLLDDVEGP